jgi:hypothetical protein
MENGLPASSISTTKDSSFLSQIPLNGGLEFLSTHFRSTHSLDEKLDENEWPRLLAEDDDSAPSPSWFESGDEDSFHRPDRLEGAGHIEFPPFYGEGEKPYGPEELRAIGLLEDAVRRATAPAEGTEEVPCPICRGDASKGSRFSPDHHIADTCPICFTECSDVVVDHCGHKFCGECFVQIGGTIDGEEPQEKGDEHRVQDLVNALQHALQECSKEEGHEPLLRVAKVACYVIRNLIDDDITLNGEPWLNSTTFTGPLLRGLMKAVEEDDSTVDPTHEKDFFGEHTLKAFAFDAMTEVLDGLGDDFSHEDDFTDLLVEVRDWSMAFLQQHLHRYDYGSEDDKNSTRFLLHTLHSYGRIVEGPDMSTFVSSYLPHLRLLLEKSEGTRELYPEVSALVSQICTTMGGGHAIGLKAFMPLFMPRLLAAIQNPKERDECEAAMECLGDICRSTGGDNICNVLGLAENKCVSSPHHRRHPAELFVRALVQNLDDPALPSKLRPHCLVGLGDVALALEHSDQGDFQHFISGPFGVAEALLHASKQAVGDIEVHIDDKDDDDDDDDDEGDPGERRRAYMIELQSAVVSAFTCIINGLVSNDVQESTTSLIFREGISKLLSDIPLEPALLIEAYLRTELVESILGLVGDICRTRSPVLGGKEAVLPLITQELGVDRLFQFAEQSPFSMCTESRAQYAREQMDKLINPEEEEEEDDDDDDSQWETIDSDDEREPEHGVDPNVMIWGAPVPGDLNWGDEMEKEEEVYNDPMHAASLTDPKQNRRQSRR